MKTRIHVNQHNVKANAKGATYDAGYRKGEPTCSTK